MMKSEFRIWSQKRSRLKKTGLSYEAIQKILGHSNIRTTMMYIYDYATPEYQDTVIERALGIKAR